MRLIYFLNRIFNFPNLVLILFNIGLSVFGQYPIDDHSQAPLDPLGDDTYLRLMFNNGSETYFRNWECPDGIWADDMFENDPPKCVCVKGVFAISKGLCDEEFEILTGNEHCYDISKYTIRKFTPLTGQMGLNGRANTVFRRDAPYFARLISPTPTIYVNEPVHYLFRLNDPVDFSAYASLEDGSAARLGCFEAQVPPANASVDPIMQVAELPECASEFRGPQSWCSDKEYGKYLATIKLGHKWSPKGQTAGQLYPGGGCASGKPGKPSKVKPGKKSSSGRTMKKATHHARSSTRHRGRRAAKKGSKPQKPSKPASIKPQPKCDVFDAQDIDKPMQGINYIDYFVDRAEYPKHVFHTSSLHQKETDAQTAKVAKSILDYHLGSPELKSKTKIVNNEKLPAYRYIQITRTIVEKICPEVYVPSFLLAMMVRMFRIIFLDVQSIYPYPQQLYENGSLNTEILNSLVKCKGSASPIIFKPNETCPDAGFYGTSHTGPKDEYFYGHNLSIPAEVRFNLSSVDMPLETIWKMMLLTHYYCADNFTDAFTHSEYVTRYEAFLRNPALLYRWYHPGPANEIFKIILSAWNVQEFAEGIDRCVATAQSISSYKGWLHRPADTLKWKSKYIEPELPNASNSTDSSTNSTKPNKKGSKHGKRVKRYYYQNNLWDDRAYCLLNSKAVITEVQSSQKSSCTVPPAWFQNTDN